MAADWWLPILIVLVIAIVAFILSYTAVRFGWYQKLEKPALYYNGWVYSPIWRSEERRVGKECRSRCAAGC